MSGFGWPILVCILLLLPAAFRSMRRAVRIRRRFHIAPRFRAFLKQNGLTDAEVVLDVGGDIVSGHPDRHVARVVLGEGLAAVGAYLKREHVIPWKERLYSAWLGFGFVSKSVREFRALQSLREAGIGCAEPIAAGEDGRGRAFLLVREISQAKQLHVLLRDQCPDLPGARRRILRRLGEAVARVHDAGFVHCDLYSEHILLDPDTGTVRFLDWQRSHRRRFVPWSRRWQDLAALNATVADDLATPGERRACLRAYLRTSMQTEVTGSFFRRAIRAIDRHSRLLLRLRRIRDLRNPPAAGTMPNLVWLDGEALCVTRQFQEDMGGRAREVLNSMLAPARAAGRLSRLEIPLPGPRRAQLVFRRTYHPLRWLWASLRGHRLKSAETRQAGTLFRFQRLGIPAPRVLAVGQRHPQPWRTESFLLTEETTAL